MFTLFVLGAVTILLALYLRWGFRCLPAENWQFLATVPSEKNDQGSWCGINFTWYGLLTANAYLVAVAVLLVLLGSVGVPPRATALLALTMLLCCVPASRLVAQLVEKKAHTFTVGGAVFVGMIITPPVIWLLNRFAGTALDFHLPLIATWAAIAIAYAFGEGLGRLACISFGCCYGKPLEGQTGLLARLLHDRGFVFHGSTKKIAYADGLEAVPVIPVQAMTAVLYSTCGLGAVFLFLSAHHTAAFLLTVSVTQIWRSYSETLRADYRGAGKISAYQIMGVAGLIYAVIMAAVLHHEATPLASLVAGLQGLWQPGMLLFLQGVWLTIFLYTGRSTVTGATVRFHLHQDRI
jgi:prolipoprotein diacylglyceryltransferase